jgi:hypothetical protein
MPYAVFCCRKNKNRAIDHPCLDPLDFGLGHEPKPEILLRRGRVGIFESKELAEESLRTTCKEMAGTKFAKDFMFVILECRFAKEISNA